MGTKEWKGSIGYGVAVLAAALASGPAGAAEKGYAYSYFKEQRPLRLDTERVAVLGAQESETDLAPYGLDASTVAPMAVPGWSYVGTTASVRTDSAIERAVSQIADRDHVEFVSPVFLDDQGDPVVITATILVGFDRRLDPSRAEAIIAESGAGSIVDRDWANMKRAYRLKSAARDGFKVLEAANALAQRPEVKFAEPDMMVTGHFDVFPNDTYFPQMWGLHNDGTLSLPCTPVVDFDMDAPEAWDITTGNPSIIVAILDSGIQQNHPDLNLYTPGFDTTGQGGGGSPVNVCDNHGTEVAGCVSGIMSNGVGIVGVAPGVRSASVRVAISAIPCSNAATIMASWVVEGLMRAESIGARISNSSFSRTPSSAMTQKYADTRANGMIHFSSAGNNASATIGYPASLPSVNAVAALDTCGHRASFSNYGVGLDFSAPGHYITSTDRTGADGNNDGTNDGACVPIGIIGCNSNADCPAGNTCLLVSPDYALVVGTSFASPYVAGVAALMLSVNPSLTADQVEYGLKKSAVDPVDQDPVGYDTGFGWGFVNAANALQSASLVTPGEGTDLLVTSFDPITGNLSLSYSAACESTSHDIYYGPLTLVSMYGVTESICGIGNTGQYSGFNPGPGSYFFVLVGNAYDVEGSYGTDSVGAERPAAGVSFCGRTQLLGSMCP